MKEHVDHRPKQKALTLALTAALAVMSHAAMAQVSGPTTGPNIWTSGDLSVTSSGTISGGLTGVAASGSLGTLSNSGTIGGSIAGINNNGTISTLNNGGVVSASASTHAAGIVNSGSIGALTNSGTISNISTSSAATNAVGISNYGSIGVLTNNGLVISALTGIANNGTIGTLTNSGTIGGPLAGILNAGTIGILSNSGVIVGDDLAVYNGGTIGTLSNSGTIAALGATLEGSTAITNNGTIGLLNNSGIITGGISGLFDTGTIATLTNSGVISGGHAGIGVGILSSIAVLNNAVGGTISATGVTIAGVSQAAGILDGGSIGRLNNSGVLSGVVTALYVNPTGTLGTVTNSGLIAGNISNHSSFDLNLNGGSGAVFGTLTGFGGTTGTITNTFSNVNFGSGNLLLNDNINVGANLVNNTGTAVLQVNQTVTITGNYNQGAGANLQIGVAGGATTVGAITDTGYGRLVVSGNATIAAGSAVTLQSNGITFTAGQRYVVVDTTGTAVYNPGSLNYSINGYTSDVTGSTVANGSNSDLVLDVVSATANSTTPPTTPAPPTSAASIASSPNAVASLTGLLSYTGISNPALLNLYNAALGVLSQASPATANRIGKQLAPTQTSSASAAPTISAMNVVGGHVDGIRVAQADGGSGVATGESPADWGMWGQGYGGHASQNERDDVDGYNANYSGLLLGADKAIGDNWRAGGVFSYSNTAVNSTGDTEGDTIRINGYGLIGYASYTGSPWYVNLSGGVTQQQYDTTREVNFQGFSGTANGHFSDQQYVARAEAGYPLALSGVTLTPLASLTYSYQNQGGYTEGGGNGSALSIDGSHVNSVKSSLGANLAKAFSTRYGQIVPDLQVQWIHEFDHTAQVTGASYAADPTGQTGFTTVGATPVQDLADVSLGLTLLRANNLSLSVHYELQAGGGFVSQTGSVRLRQVF